MAHSVLLPNILFFDLYLFRLLTRRAALHRRCWGSVRVWVRVLISAAGAGWAAGLCMVLCCDGPMRCAGDRCEQVRFLLVVLIAVNNSVFVLWFPYSNCCGV